MIKNLTQSVLPMEMCRVKPICDGVENAEYMSFILSRDAVIGFYLTPNSPVLMLKINYLETNEENESDGIKEIYLRHKGTNQYYNVSEPIEEIEAENRGYICLESYELSRSNIGDIKLFDRNGKDITNTIRSVIIEMNREGIKNFATMLLVWSNNFNKNDEYMIARNGKNVGYNLGVTLTKDSIPVKLQAGDLGTIYDYTE